MATQPSSWGTGMPRMRESHLESIVAWLGTSECLLEGNIVLECFSEQKVETM